MIKLKGTNSTMSATHKAYTIKLDSQLRAVNCDIYIYIKDYCFTGRANPIFFFFEKGNF